VNVHENYEVAIWTKKWGVTKKGPSVAARQAPAVLVDELDADSPL